MSVNKAKFRRPILPNQNIQIEVSFINNVKDVYKFQGTAFLKILELRKQNLQQ